MIVAINNATEPATIAVPVADIGLDAGSVLVDHLGSPSDAVVVKAGAIALTLPARTAAILVPR